MLLIAIAMHAAPTAALAQNSQNGLPPTYPPAPVTSSPPPAPSVEPAPAPPPPGTPPYGTMPVGGPSIYNPQQPLPQARLTRTHHYGWQTLAADAVALGLTAGTEGQLWFTYLALSPAVHVLQGNHRGLLTSLGLRLSLPLGLGFAGVLVEGQNCRGEFLCGLGGFLIGGFVGMLSASVVDWTILSRKEIEVTPYAPSLTVAPTLVPTGDRVGLGLVGQF